MKKKIILVIVLVLLIAIQFVRIDQTNPSSDPKMDIAVVTTMPENVQSVLMRSCYDCHSNNTVYPWYANVAPVSWMLRNHIDEGREHMNFSLWGNYSEKDKQKMLEESVEEISKGNMPLKPYVLMHPQAKLSAEEKELVRQWFLGNSATSVVASLN